MRQRVIHRRRAASPVHRDAAREAVGPQLAPRPPQGLGGGAQRHHPLDGGHRGRGSAQGVAESVNELVQPGAHRVRRRELPRRAHSPTSRATASAARARSHASCALASAASARLPSWSTRPTNAAHARAMAVASSPGSATA